MVRHMVIFQLKHSKGSLEERAFIQESLKLSSIPGVINLECSKQVSAKNNFDFALSMEFESKQSYDDYCHHPHHVYFVQNHWIKNVEAFLEIDLEAYNP
jgi:hypothetical protein